MPSPKVWSFSTTIRAPERIRGFLHVLKMLEGVEYDQESQVRFQTLLIKEKKYRPTNLTEEEKTVCQDPDVAFSEEQASEIFNRQGYEDPPMRGRTSFAPLVEMGLAYVDDERLIRISELGKYFLSEDYDISKVFLRFLIKWQYPNPLSTHFSEVRGFNVKPFLVTLHLIKRVNELWAEEGNEPVGLSNDEFNMFTATLINYEDIESQAQRLIEYRKAVRSRPGREQPAFKEQYKHDFVAAHFDINDESAIRTQIDNLRDYGDNARRLFRLSQYLHIRGKGHFVDLEPLRTAEITPLLSEFDGSADAFPSVEAYTDYMVNMNLPRLPWINVESLTAIAQTVVDDIKVIQHLITDRGGSFDEAPEEDPSGMSEGQLEDYIELLRSYRRELQLSQQILESQDAEVIEDCIQALEDIQNRKTPINGLQPSVALEKYATVALNILDDALRIKPNYPVGDDGEPLMTAGGNMPDIECYYEDYEAICEVTTIRGRDQYYYEGHPVIRHLRDFAKPRDNLESSYLLFVAPVIHEDTADHFLYQLRTLHEGKRQNVVPFTIPQLINLIEIYLDLRGDGRKLTHEQIKYLMDLVIALKDDAESAYNWINTIPDIIEQWRAECFA